MVASSFFDVSTHEQNHNRSEALSSVKRRRVSASDNYNGVSSHEPAMSGACSPSSGLSSCSDLETGNESIFCLEMTCQANGNAETAPHTTGAGGVPHSEKNSGGYGLSAFVSGWMYINEQGQMCGPYAQEQLFEGLSSGFLPDELPVYPVVNGAFMSPVPLKFFKQYPDHVATGFVYLGGVTSNVSATRSCPVGPVLDACQSSASVSVNVCQQAFVQHDTSISNAVASDPVATSTSTVVQQPLAWEERCWLFLDEYRRNNGPHSLSELYYWHQYGYLHDSVMIHHTENKSNPFTLQSLTDAWRKDNSCSAAFWNIIGNEPSGSFDFISGLSGEIGSQLHGGIMKAARRFFLDEIIGNVIVDFVATKKAQKQQKNEHPTENVRAYTLDGEKVNVGERRDSASCTASGACFDASGSTNTANKYCQDLSMDLKMKSVGGFENLRTANIAISRVLFSYCMEVLWNAVFYDPVANYTLTWRNSRRWSQSNIGNEASEREPVLPVEEFDFPPGFQPRVEESLVCGSFSMSQSNFSEDKSSKPGSMVRAPMLKVEQEEIIEAVKKKLFLAAKESSDVFLIAALEEEVYALVKDLKVDGSKEVAIVSSKQVCNETDPATSGERTGCEMVQGLDSEGNGVDVSQTPMEGTESSNQADMSFHKHSLCDFLENGFKRLGTPATTVIDDQTVDEPDPPGLYCLKRIMPFQHLQMCLVGRSETPNQGLGSSHQAAASVYEKVSDFLGSAFKRLGTPTFGGVNVQRTDEPPPPGYENQIDKVVRSSYRKIRQLGPSEGIPKWRKFVLLALFRQKLHDDVLSEWISSFDDDVRFKFLVSWCNLKQCKAGQVKPASESGRLLELSSVMEPDLDDLLERSKSCHSSGPSEVSVDMFTYSRKKKARKNSGDDPESPTLVDMILRRQSFKNFGKQKSSRDESGSGACGVVNVKHKINGTSWKPIESAVGTSKVGGTVKEKGNKDRLTIRTPATKKPPRMAGASQDKVLVSHVKSGMSMVSGREVISKDTEELSSTKICDVVCEDKFAADQSQTLHKSSKKKKLKREHVMDDSLPLLSKVPRLIDSYVKKTAGKKVAKSRILTNKLKLLSSCPISDGCARSSINGWEWRNWSLTARPAERARVRGIQITTVQRFSAEIIVSQSSNVKGISARTNRVKMRNLLAAAEGAEMLKASQLNARKKRLRFQQSKIHDWGLVALEPIEADDFVIEYVGELIRPRISDIRELQYEKMGIGSSYLFRLDDGYVVDATKRGGVARFINHSCEPNCYTKIVSVEGQKRIFIYAKRHVAAGEEITYNYKFPLEEKKIPCNCGSKRCRGSMN